MDPIFTDPELPRYTATAFPAYRYLPFVPGMAHPRRDPTGHSYGQEDEFLADFDPDSWRSCQPYLYGIDLFNHGYWWEAHEALEAVWFAAGQETLPGNFVQGIIQLAAAQLKRFTGAERGARMLTETGVAKVSLASGTYLGIEVASLVSEVERCLHEDRGEFPRVRLIF
jgi:hypothetical protein